MPQQTNVPSSSFIQPAPDPGVEPTAAPVCVFVVSAAWVPVILGALHQLVAPWAWDVAPGPTLDLVQQRATELLDLFGSCGASGPLPYFQLTPDGKFNYSPDNETWTLLLQFPPLPLGSDYGWTGPDNFLGNGAPFPYIWDATGGQFVQR